jgi:hypothetical protein
VRSGRIRRAGTTVAAVATAGLLLAACATVSVGPTTVTPTPNLAPSLTADSQVNALNQLRLEVQGFSHIESFATYYLQNGSQQSSAIYSILPPEFYISVGHASYISTTSGAWFCATQQRCQAHPASDPLAGSIPFYSGVEFLHHIATLTSAAAIAAAHVTLSFSSATYTGRVSSCVTIHFATGGATTWCIATASGVLAYWKSGNDSATLTEYSQYALGDFYSPPEGAVITNS